MAYARAVRVCRACVPCVCAVSCVPCVWNVPCVPCVWDVPCVCAVYVCSSLPLLRSFSHLLNSRPNLARPHCRCLQISHHQKPTFACGALFLLSEVMKTHGHMFKNVLRARGGVRVRDADEIAAAEAAAAEAAKPKGGIGAPDADGIEIGGAVLGTRKGRKKFASGAVPGEAAIEAIEAMDADGQLSSGEDAGPDGGSVSGTESDDNDDDNDDDSADGDDSDADADGDDGVEKKAKKPKQAARRAKGTGYDIRARDPKYARAGREPLWELESLTGTSGDLEL